MNSALSSSPRSPRTIEMIHPAPPRSIHALTWVLIAGLSLLGVIGFFLGLRLWLISTIQAPLEGRLEYLMDWLGLPVSLGSLTWMLTFGIGAFTAWPLVKKTLFFITGIPWFCPAPREWLLLLILPASTLLPATVQTLCPIREVDPVTAAWFYPDAHPETGNPHGRIGYLREADGTWHFYNVPSFLRESDAAPVLRVTPEVRQQWHQDHARRQELENRLQEENRIRQEAEDRLAEEKSAALQQKHEQEQKQEQKQEQEEELTRLRQELLRAQEERAVPRAIPVEDDLPDPGHDSAPPPVRDYPLYRGKVFRLPVGGKSLWLSSDGPMAVSPDGVSWRPVGAGVPVHFLPGRESVHVRPLGPRATSVTIRHMVPQSSGENSSQTRVSTTTEHKR